MRVFKSFNCVTSLSAKNTTFKLCLFGVFLFNLTIANSRKCEIEYTKKLNKKVNCMK